MPSLVPGGWERFAYSALLGVGSVKSTLRSLFDRQETTVLMKDYELPDGRTIKVGAERCRPHHSLSQADLCTHQAVCTFALGRRRNAAPLVCVDEICHNQLCKRE